MTIRWITSLLGTGAAQNVVGVVDGVEVIDVRELVDKGGNRSTTVRQKIDQAVASLQQGKKTVICCDYGMSRSNAVAAGVLSIYERIDFFSAVKKVQGATGEREIKPEPLEAVRYALGGVVGKNSLVGRRQVLVTGASGFIGRSLLPRLQEDFEVVAPSRSDIDIESGSTSLNVLAAERQVDCIVHLANPRIYTSNKAFGATITMLRNVIDVCTARDIRLVYLSGWEVYSAYRGKILADESLPLHSKGPYGDAKYLAEMLIKQSIKINDLKCAVLRSGPVYGVGSDRPKFIYNFLEKARSGEKIVTHCYANGMPALDLMHVHDLVRAITGVVHERLTGEFNLGTGVLTDTYQIARRIVGLLGSSSEVSSVSVDASVASIAMDYSKAKNSFGWAPSVLFENGLKGIVEKELYVGK